MYTVTGAWSRVPAAPGRSAAPVTGIVVAVPRRPGRGVVATVPTDDTTPGVAVPSGSVTRHRVPRLHLRLLRDIQRDHHHVLVRRRRSTGPDAGPPSLPVTWATRIAAGSNTTCPGDSDPSGKETPRCCSSRCTPYAVVKEK